MIICVSQTLAGGKDNGKTFSATVENVLRGAFLFFLSSVSYEISAEMSFFPTLGSGAIQPCGTRGHWSKG